METGRGWGMWCGSWMAVDGECGVLLIWGRWGMCVFVDGGIWGMGDGRIGRIANGGNLKLSVYAVYTNIIFLYIFIYIFYLYIIVY